MTRMVIAVGGTGQMVLLYYLQLYLLGVVDQPFRAVVIDTDEIIPGIQAISRFLGALQYGSESGAALGAQLPSIATIRPSAGGGETLTEILTGSLSIRAGETHPVQAFFSFETREQKLRQGLFARPALSSVLSLESLKGPELRPPARSTVVVVGSVIGGTGGGLMVPILDSLQSFQLREGIADLKVRGVFFGHYFAPEKDRLKDEILRFNSSQALVLKTMSDALQRVLHSYYIVGGTGDTVERDPEAEKRGVDLPWPRVSTHPFWEGVQGLDFLLSESAKDIAADFFEREFSEVDPKPDLMSARLRLSQAVAIAQKLIQKEVMVRLTRENWLETVWGKRLADLVAHYWRTAARAEGREGAMRDFPRQVQGALEAAWNGEDDELGLRQVLPAPDELVKVRPAHIRKVQWPEPKIAGSQDNSLFSGQGEAARRLAAVLLFWVLRRGELK